ncbi:xanthine/uracil/vitamin C permease (AzgA family) [Nitrobacteraceae bacterium AZCC 1564]
MSRDWRISTFNGVLLASYFIPSWTISAMKIWVSPIRGLYDRSNVGPAMYVSDFMNLSALGTTRFAWMLALSKVMVAAFFLLFLLLIIREAIRKKGNSDEALGFALGLGAFVSMASLIAASKVGEQAALHLHASEALLLLGATILLVIDNDKKAAASTTRAAEMPQRAYLSSSPSS